MVQWRPLAHRTGPRGRDSEGRIEENQASSRTACFYLVGADTQRWPLERRPLTIGGSPQCTITIEHRTVATRHAAVWVANGRCWVRDEHTRHGTWVNGARVTRSHELFIGDHLRVGPATFRIEFASAGCASQPPSRVANGNAEPAVVRRATWLPPLLWLAIFTGLLVIAAVGVLIRKPELLDALGRRFQSPEAVSASVNVPLGTALELQPEDLPWVYLPANALDQDATLRIRSTGDPPAMPNATFGGPAFDVSLTDRHLRQAMELALPLALPEGADLDAGEAFVAIGQRDQDWFALPSWLSPGRGRVHATTDEASLIAAFYASAPTVPRVTLKQASPDPYSGTGWPPCFQERLEFGIKAQDPDGLIVEVQIRVRVQSLPTDLATDSARYAAYLSGKTLEVETHDLLTGMPAVSARLELVEAGTANEARTNWHSLPLAPSQAVAFQGSLDLDKISTCGSAPGVAATLAASESRSIVLDVRLIDDTGIDLYDSLRIPVYAEPLPVAVPRLPGPGLDDVVGTRPVFSWDVQFLQPGCQQTLVYAAGFELWENHWGRVPVPVASEAVEWFADRDLDPGTYTWGVEISCEGWFGTRSPTRSRVHMFTVSP